MLTQRTVRMSRAWAMPSSETFSIPPIAEFLGRWLPGNGAVIVDPFARNSKVGTITNDLNPETSAEFHMECEDFLAMLIERGVRADVVILDPPYSPRQVKECYNGIGRAMKTEDAWGGAVRKRRRALIEQMVADDAVVLTFGWDTNGMGRGWSIHEILIVAHGSDHNDTICMAERKSPTLFETRALTHSKVKP